MKSQIDESDAVSFCSGTRHLKCCQSLAACQVLGSFDLTFTFWPRGQYTTILCPSDETFGDVELLGDYDRSKKTV